MHFAVVVEYCNLQLQTVALKLNIFLIFFLYYRRLTSRSESLVLVGGWDGLWLNNVTISKFIFLLVNVLNNYQSIYLSVFIFIHFYIYKKK